MTRPYFASALTKLYQSDEHAGQWVLAQGQITVSGEDLSGFVELADFVRALTYPTPQWDKAESYGWTPSLFLEGHREDRHGNRRFGRWRRGEFEIDEMSCFVADVDNANEGQPMLTLDDLTERLEASGLAWFAYTSRSSTPEKNKFRIVIDTSRVMTRAEAIRVFLYLNPLFNEQADATIYDPSDFLYAPPCGGEWRQGSGGALDVDDIVEQVRANPALDAMADNLVRAARVAVPLSAEQKAEVDALMAVTIAASHASIANPLIFHKRWGEEYVACAAGGHYATMLRVLGKVWVMSGHNGVTLTRGDMESIAQQIDWLSGGYMQSHYDADKLPEMVRFVLKQPKPQRDPFADEVDALATKRIAEPKRGLRERLGEEAYARLCAEAEAARAAGTAVMIPDVPRTSHQRRRDGEVL